MAQKRPLSLLETALRRLCADLVAAEARFALVGGLAVSVRTEPRFTRDADLVVALEGDEEAEALILHLQQGGYAVVATVEQNAADRLATVRLRPSGAAEMGALLDLLFASSGIEGEIVAEAELLEILPELRVPVAKIEHLIALKILSRDDRERPQDIIDLRALTKQASNEELARAQTALALIESRGFHRERHLRSLFEDFLRKDR